MKHLFLLFALLLTMSTNAQLSVFAENADFLEYDDTENRYRPKTYAGAGLNYQHEIREGIFYEAKLIGRLNSGKGYYLNHGVYFNRTPQFDRVHFLTGLGMSYDGFRKKADYLVDIRFRINFTPLYFEAGAAINLKENFREGPLPKGYIRVMYTIGRNRNQHWRK